MNLRITNKNMIRDMNLSGEQVIVWGGMRRELLLEELLPNMHVI